jgi:hypothetical protein
MCGLRGSSLAAPREAVLASHFVSEQEQTHQALQFNLLVSAFSALPLFGHAFLVMNVPKRHSITGCS